MSKITIDYLEILSIVFFVCKVYEVSVFSCDTVDGIEIGWFLWHFYDLTAGVDVIVSFFWHITQDAKKLIKKLVLKKRQFTYNSFELIFFFFFLAELNDFFLSPGLVIF